MIFIIFLILLGQNVFSAKICDTLGANFYEEMGCKPIFNSNNICPDNYLCDYSLKEGHCRYQNKYYKEGEIITALDGSMNCQCSLKNNVSNFDCNYTNCPNYIPSKENCYEIFSHDQFCPIGEKCGNNHHTCEDHNSTFREGEIFNPNNTCYDCICESGFNGSVSEPLCRRIDYTLEISYQSEFVEKCGPVYYRDKKDEVLCLPSNFVCPNSNSTVEFIKKSKNPTGVQCEFGAEKFYKEDIFNITTVDYWGVENVYRCKCLLPPLVTCYYYLLF